MKKIALLSDGWKRFLVYAWVDGIMGYATSHDVDICLYHYNCYGNWSHDARHNQGEYNIFKLPDLSGFDGIVLDCNNIVDKAQMDRLVQLVKSYDVPVVSINYDIEGFYYVGINNVKPVTELMEHLYYEHGCRSFLFAGGPEGNFENAMRVNTFRDCLARFGLNPDENPVWYRDYDFDSGIYYMQKLSRDGGKLPDAIVCANDNIAAGLMTEAERRGYHVPEDFVVTGFDNLDKAQYFQPQITTVHHHRGEIGMKALEILCRVLDGEKLEKFHMIDTECIFSESCGCPNSNAVDYRAYMKNQITYGVEKDKEDVKLVDLEADMAMCRSFEEIFQKMGDFLQNYSCDGFFVVVDKNLLAGKDETEFTIEDYNRDNLELVYAQDFVGEMEIGSVEELNSYIHSFGSGSHFLHTPIHFGERTVGYSIAKNARFLYDNSGYFYSMHSAMMKEMESLYHRLQLENMYKELREIYNRDQLTGLFNRIAYNERMEPEFAEYNKANVICTVAFVDVNKFKQINDTYGHKYGDEVLKKVAELIQNNCTEDGYCYRYGGDEFVMFLPNMDEEGARKLKAAMKREAESINVGISIGIAVTEPGADKTMKAYMEIADQDMYADKTLGRE